MDDIVKEYLPEEKCASKPVSIFESSILKMCESKLIVQNFVKCARRRNLTNMSCSCRAVARGILTVLERGNY